MPHGAHQRNAAQQPVHQQRHAAADGTLDQHAQQQDGQGHDAQADQVAHEF
jgi:hypothetical protein